MSLCASQCQGSLLKDIKGKIYFTMSYYYKRQKCHWAMVLAMEAICSLCCLHIITACSSQCLMARRLKAIRNRGLFKAAESLFMVNTKKLNKQMNKQSNSTNSSKEQQLGTFGCGGAHKRMQ